MPTVRTSDGVNISYETSGAGDPVVLIHGLGSFVGDWQAQTDALAREFQVVAIDLRGHGESDKPPGPYSVPLFASDVGAVIRALRLGPSHVVGLSLGGAVAFQLAVDQPALVRSLTIINSGPAFVMSSLQLRFAIFLRLFVLKTFGLKALGRMIVKRLFPKPGQEPLRQRFLDHYVHNDPVAYEASTRALVGWTVADRLGTIGCPVLVISGDRDYTPVAAKEPYVAALPDARLVVVPDAGHACTIERPAEVNGIIRDFLAAAPATTAP
jgi:pimeloyl-ACP methyl ester carboxylesterase